MVILIMKCLKKLILWLSVISVCLATLSIFSPIIAFIASEYNYEFIWLWGLRLNDDAPIELFTLEDPIFIIGILSIIFLTVSLGLMVLTLKSINWFSKIRKIPINSIFNLIAGFILVVTPYFFYYITGSFYSSLFFIDYKFSIGFYIMLSSGGFIITAGILRVIKQIFYKNKESENVSEPLFS